MGAEAVRRWAVWSVVCGGLVLAGGVSLAEVDINRASEEQLRQVKGIGAATARRIVAERSRGAYESLEHLAERVSGLGVKRLQQLRAAGLCASTPVKPCQTEMPKAAAKAAGATTRELATPAVIRLP